MSDISGVSGVNNGTNETNKTNETNTKIDIPELLPELTPLISIDNNQNCIEKIKTQWKCNVLNMTEIDYLFAVLLAAGIGITFYITYKA